MLIRLQRFYGGNPREWLRLPVFLLKAYIAAMGRLMAEEALEQVARTLVGTGNMDKDDANKNIRAWQRAADVLPKAQKMSREEKMEVMKGMGIQVG
jgi:hypothetical protein